MSDISVLIRDLPTEVNRVLNALALIRGVTKWEITREALIEFARRHQRELVKRLPRLAKGVQSDER